jgi:hypothetical protein
VAICGLVCLAVEGNIRRYSANACVIEGWWKNWRFMRGDFPLQVRFGASMTNLSGHLQGCMVQIMIMTRSFFGMSCLDL